MRNDLRYVRTDRSKNADIIIKETPAIKADPELIRRVFANLIANSLKYSKPDNAPVVTISSERQAEKVTFSIADNGIGIEARHAEKIFEPMQRLHDHDSEYDGVGIGLPLVKAIIESHGGAIWLDKDYAEGARFCFSVPTDEVDNRELP
ncbi:ATP-binding protein [Marinicaulis aureus]|uniref:histidine kinase n=1 Tax=Hyphococcus aureus TaxID=2666033 RepID=A0ABW1KQU0_9PROT